MNSKKVIQYIYYNIMGENVKISRARSSGASISYRSVTENDIVKSVVPIELQIGSDNYHIISTKVIPYLDKKAQDVWKQYNVNLLCILHEVGHIKTMKGQNEKQANLAKQNARCNARDNDELAKVYRQLDDEKKADNWAYEWAIKHPNMAKHYSMMLDIAGV